MIITFEFMIEIFLEFRFEMISNLNGDAGQEIALWDFGVGQEKSTLALK